LTIFTQGLSIKLGGGGGGGVEKQKMNIKYSSKVCQGRVPLATKKLACHTQDIDWMKAWGLRVKGEGEGEEEIKYERNCKERTNKLNVKLQLRSTFNREL